ncbi:MAG: type II toxin-antitoxin system VapC family toxin [Candidatus Hydrogenedentota bacterium]
METKSVYIETSVISYLTARPSNNLMVAAWQQATMDWWDNPRVRFDLYTSDATIEEASQGDPEAARKRLVILEAIPVLPLTEMGRYLTRALLSEGALPEKALGDAVHIAIAATHEVNYLLTWNCRHIHNAEMKPLIRHVCMLSGLQCPEICTPQELMGV